MIKRLCVALAAAFIAAPAFAADNTIRFPALQTETGRLTIYSATDLVVMKPLIDDFQTIWPDVTVDVIDYLTNELSVRAAEACRKQQPLGDLLLSSSVGSTCETGQ